MHGRQSEPTHGSNGGWGSLSLSPSLCLCVNLPLASYLSIAIERHRKPGNDLAFATAVAVLSRAQFWLLRRHVFRNIFRGAHEYLNALLSTCFRRCFRAWRFCFSVLAFAATCVSQFLSRCTWISKCASIYLLSPLLSRLEVLLLRGSR